jgi:cell wall-associated NlpC family hydrolase
MPGAWACDTLTACRKPTPSAEPKPHRCRCYPAAPMHKLLFTALLAKSALRKLVLLSFVLLAFGGCAHRPAPAPMVKPSADSALVPRPRDGASDLVLLAMGFLGVSYTPGGNSAEQGFDCSGFTRHVFQNSLGLLLPRRAEDQANHAALDSVKAEELRPGDLVFFNTLKRTFSHVGIYVGEGRFIHAPRVGGEVRIEDLRVAYWSQRFDGARRASAKPDGGLAPPTAPLSMAPAGVNPAP